MVYWYMNTLDIPTGFRTTEGLNKNNEDMKIKNPC